MSTKQQPKQQISIDTQYVKDLSFENPGAPMSLTKVKSSPQIDLAIDIEVHPLSEDKKVYEVVLNMNAKALVAGEKIFLVELKYAGIFSLVNFEDKEREMMLAVYAPSILFPFARKIMADATQNGGFQPLMIDPIDFGSLYQKKLSEDKNKQN